MMFLITGCGRSGTKYMTRVLKAAGLDVGHERRGQDGTVSSCWAVETGPYPRFHAQDRPDFDLVLHQVREPLATIGSLTTASEAGWDFVCAHTPIQRNAPLLERAAQHWYYWNLLCESKTVWRYRIEDLENVWHTLRQLIDMSAIFPSKIPTNVNTRRHRTVSWTDLHKATVLYEPIREMAKRYGYEV